MNTSAIPEATLVATSTPWPTVMEVTELFESVKEKKKRVCKSCWKKTTARMFYNFQTNPYPFVCQKCFENSMGKKKGGKRTLWRQTSSGANKKCKWMEHCDRPAQTKSCKGSLGIWTSIHAMTEGTLQHCLRCASKCVGFWFFFFWLLFFLLFLNKKKHLVARI